MKPNQSKSGENEVRKATKRHREERYGCKFSAAWEGAARQKNEELDLNKVLRLDRLEEESRPAILSLAPHSVLESVSHTQSFLTSTLISL